MEPNYRVSNTGLQSVYLAQFVYGGSNDSDVAITTKRILRRFSLHRKIHTYRTVNNCTY